MQLNTKPTTHVYSYTSRYFPTSISGNIYYLAGYFTDHAHDDGDMQHHLQIIATLHKIDPGCSIFIRHLVTQDDVEDVSCHVDTTATGLEITKDNPWDNYALPIALTKGVVLFFFQPICTTQSTHNPVQAIKLFHKNKPTDGPLRTRTLITAASCSEQSIRKNEILTTAMELNLLCEEKLVIHRSIDELCKQALHLQNYRANERSEQDRFLHTDLYNINDDIDAAIKDEHRFRHINRVLQRIANLVR